MRKAWFFSTVFLLSSLAIKAATITPYIVNGTPTTSIAHPTFASIYTYADFHDGSYLSGARCGATVLNSTHILTAAHCVSNKDISAFLQEFTIVLPQLSNQADFDKISEFLATTKYWVSDIFVHPSYNDSTIENDIAILRLETALPGTIPSVNIVGNQNEYRGLASQNYIAVGHGNTQTGVDSTTQLQQTTLNLVANALCGYSGVAPATQLCMAGAAIMNNLENATCQGDSGGPLYWTDTVPNPDVTYQVGITSYGPGTPYTCGSTTFPGATSVFTEVVDYQPWIADIIANTGSATENTAREATPSDGARNVYRANNTANDFVSQPSVSAPSSSSGSSGGSIPLWLLLLLPVITYVRQRRL
ncbi:serine protease [Vibrio sp. MACH09]|uniref:S1 family peptidase n=1 Tax=Vibrio sp. MACH09 TaxID=3025122 RepID=UPI00278E73A6|nr:serine protease [Vibrio sp. MACH09]GLO63883.1 serine protease [Vibrio sp. MACH09]